jgi:hypothetical protein
MSTIQVSLLLLFGLGKKIASFLYPQAAPTGSPLIYSNINTILLVEKSPLKNL